MTGKNVFLFGKDVMVSDVPLDHVTCSKQHAVIQFRHHTKELDDGTYVTGIKPYLMDLESTNGTTLNGEKIEATRLVYFLWVNLGLKFSVGIMSYWKKMLSSLDSWRGTMS